MKVNGSGPAPGIAPASGRGKPSTSGFTLGGVDSVPSGAPAARTMGAASLTSVDALLALQEQPNLLDRRRRAVKRAGRILDHLEQVKLTLLEAGPAEGALDQLAAAVREAREDTSDEGLEGVLNDIETRAAVELAKREVALRAR